MEKTWRGKSPPLIKSLRSRIRMDNPYLIDFFWRKETIQMMNNRTEKSDILVRIPHPRPLMQTSPSFPLLSERDDRR